jgi:hypothetical protein
MHRRLLIHTQYVRVSQTKQYSVSELHTDSSILARGALAIFAGARFYMSRYTPRRLAGSHASTQTMGTRGGVY